MSSSNDSSWAARAIGSNYAFTVAYTIFMMDYCETLEEEVSLIWPDRLRVGKMLFLLSRYLTISRLPLQIIPFFPTNAQPSSKACKICYDTMFTITIICTITTTLSLVLCAHALLGAHKRYLFALVTLMGSFIAAGTVFSVIYLHSTRWRISDMPWISPCLLESDAKYYLGINGYLSFAREFVLAIPMAWAIYRRSRDYPNSLLKVLRRDSGLYFSVLIVSGIMLAVFYTPGSPVRAHFVIYWSSCANVNPPGLRQIRYNDRNAHVSLSDPRKQDTAQHQDHKRHEDENRGDLNPALLARGNYGHRRVLNELMWTSMGLVDMDSFMFTKHRTRRLLSGAIEPS